MNEFKKKIRNFWYYYKAQTIIVLIILASVLWFMTLGKIPPDDYIIGIVSPRGFSGDQLVRIRSVFEQAGMDLNRDGSVNVKLNLFRFAIGTEGADSTEIARLDADLVGHESGIFFTEDPEAFEAATNGIGKATDAVPVSEVPAFSDCGIDELFFLLRKDADPKYSEIRRQLMK